MTDPAASARDDLAFLRGLVSDRGRIQSSLGQALFGGGLCYGTQCLAQVLLAYLPAAPGVQAGLQLLAGTLPTLVFIGLMVRIGMRDRRDKVGVGEAVASRALKGAFSALGASTLVTAAIFGYVAWQERNLTIWLFHPMMVCVGQGVGWNVMFAIRRRNWFQIVSLCWFACALLLATLLQHLEAFILTLSAALYLLMALPGWILQRTAGSDA